MHRHISIRKAAADARKKKGELLPQSRQVFADWLEHIKTADIGFDKVSATQPDPNAPQLNAGNQSHIAKSGSYVLRLMNPTGKDFNRISVDVPNKTRLLITSHGVITVSTPLAEEDHAEQQQRLWTPVHDIRFFDSEDIGRQTDMQFGRVQTSNTGLEISAPYAYFSQNAQGLMGRMFERCVAVIGEEQHALEPSTVSTPTSHLAPQQ